MINTTLCYIRKDGNYLMLYRNKKENDLNEGKWVGVGGKFEPGETGDECVKREVREETGLLIKDPHFYGIIKFISDRYEAEDMYLYSADSFEGELTRECDEGELRWVPEEELLSLNMWEGDHFFLERIVRGDDRIDLTLRYEGDALVEALDENGMDLQKD